MRHPSLRPVLVLALGLAGLGGSRVPLLAQTATAGVRAPDYAALIGPFPAPGSDRAKADLAILLWLQQARTREDIQRAKQELSYPLGIFSAVLGRDLDSGRFPLTLALAERARLDLRAAMAPVKQQFARQRPFLAMPGVIVPAVERENTYSYPSGHSAWGVMEAMLLVALQPQLQAQDREAILARGRLVGYDRSLTGGHYPSDVEAGQKLGAAFAEAWLADPAHRKLLEAARAAEWQH
jgi:membrane-associated phospholipid phosphatase